MAYRVEGKDIVISGFEKGISDSPYTGVADMRNLEIVSMPGEAYVQFAQTAAQQPPAVNATAYTAAASTDRLTWSNAATLYEGVAIVLAANTATGLSNGVVYYVCNIVGATFQLRLIPLSGAVVDITVDGTGTFTTYQYGNQRAIGAQAPVSYWIDKTQASGAGSSMYIVDGSNYVWGMLTQTVGNIPAYALVFLGNIGGVGATSITSSGIAVWNGYLLLFGSVTSGVDYANANGLWLGAGPASAWHYTWQNRSTQQTNGRIGILVSQEDGNLYFTSTSGLGSLIQQPGSTFNPATPATYAITDTAVQVPATDEATCIAELGTSLLIGGQNSFVYVWDKLSLGFTNLLNFPDVFVTAIVAANSNAYVFAGNRGRIYVTNGSAVDLYKKIPDYVTGVITPFIQWQDASFIRNQLIFGFFARNNAGTVLTSVAGVWGINLDNAALRMIVKTTKLDYAGFTTMTAEIPPQSGTLATDPGYGIITGWYSGSTYGVDIGTSNPYTNYESYLETEMIPVGTFLNPFTPSQIEWKTSAPLVAGESVRLSYRTSFGVDYALITDPVHTTGESNTVGSISDMFQTNFQKAQWTQFKAELKSTATTPSFNRLTELRVRDWPSGTVIPVKTYGR